MNAGSASPSCSWLDREGLLRREQGLSLDGHLAGCGTCQRRLDGYQRLGAALAVSPAPPPGWQDQVWRRIERGEQATSKHSRCGWLVWSFPVLTAAAVAVLLLLARTGGQDQSPVVLAVAVQDARGATRVRGEIRPGGAIRIDARGLRAPFSELRVYRDDLELVASCTTLPPCQRQGDRLSARVPIITVGAYRAVLFTSDRPLPVSSGNYDADDAAARAGGATPHPADVVEVW